MIAASGRPYVYGPDPAGTPGIGTTADHFAFELQIPSWTLEVEPASGGQDYGGLATHGHSGFILPAAEAARMRNDVVRQYLLGFYRQSGPPAAIAAEIRETAGNTVVYRATWDRSGSATRALTVETNEALLPGVNYRLWVAFNKPMRIRNSSGALVSYAGQSPGAAVGTVTLEIPSLTGQDISLGGTATWLNTAGGAPNGYLRYSDDAFAVDFTVPGNVGVTAATPAVLFLNQVDLSQMALDGDPGSAVDWGNGAWLGYEDTDGCRWRCRRRRLLVQALCRRRGRRGTTRHRRRLPGRGPAAATSASASSTTARSWRRRWRGFGPAAAPGIVDGPGASTRRIGLWPKLRESRHLLMSVTGQEGSPGEGCPSSSH